MPPLSVADTSVELFGPATWAPYLWDVATWDGSGVVWWGDEWNDVDCQVTEAAIAWGADNTAGVLAQSAAGQLLMTTYDPDGLLDPANVASPYRPMLKPGTPLRVTYAGTSLREGRLREVSYDRHSRTGRLEGRDAIGELAAAETPETFRATSNGLYAFAAEVIAAAAASIPVAAAPGGVDVVIAWRERTGGQNVWGLIRDAAFDALHLAYVDPSGVLAFAPFGSPFDRGLVIGDGGICLEELETVADDQDVYTDVTDGAAPLVVSGQRDPRMLSVDRREPANRPWAAAIVADRASGAVQYTPTVIRPVSVAELSALAAVRGCDKVRLRLTSAPALDVNGRVLGETLRAPAGGAWSAGIRMWVPPSDWAYVPPTPAAVSGIPMTATAPCVADTEIANVWNITPTPARAQASGAGRNTGASVSGGSATAGATRYPTRMLATFDLTAPELLAGMRIYRSAQVRLYCSGTDPGVPTLGVQRVMEPWSEGYGNSLLEFNQNGAIWPGPATTNAGESSGPAPTAAGYWTIDVSAIVRAWLPRSLGGDGLPNLGLEIFSSAEATPAGSTFRTRESPFGTPPVLMIAGEG